MHGQNNIKKEFSSLQSPLSIILPFPNKLQLCHRVRNCSGDTSMHQFISLFDLKS